MKPLPRFFWLKHRTDKMQTLGSLGAWSEQVSSAPKMISNFWTLSRMDNQHMFIFKHDSTLSPTSWFRWKQSKLGDIRMNPTYLPEPNPPKTKFTPQIPTCPCLFNQQLIGWTSWTSNSLVDPLNLNPFPHIFRDNEKNFQTTGPKQEVFPYRLQYVAQIVGFADLLGHDASQKVPNIFSQMVV